MGLKRGQLATLLGVSKKRIRKLENSGSARAGKSRQIPNAITLACFALSRGVSQFDGKTARNSFNGLGASEDIIMEKPIDKNRRTHALKDKRAKRARRGKN